MPKKDTPAKKTRKTKAKSTKAKAKAKAGAKASVVSNIQNKIVIGDLGGAKKPSRRRRAPNKPKQPTQPQIPIASYTSPYMTFGLPPQYDDDVKNDLQRIKNLLEESPTATPPLLKEPPTRALLEAPPTRALLKEPPRYARLENTSMPSESEEVPPENTYLALEEPRTDSSIYSNTLTNYFSSKPKKSALIDDGSDLIQPTSERAPSIPIPKKKALIEEDEWEDVYDTPTYADVIDANPKPSGRPVMSGRLRYLKSELHNVNNQLKRGNIKKESTMNRLLARKKELDDEIQTLESKPLDPYEQMVNEYFPSTPLIPDEPDEPKAKSKSKVKVTKVTKMPNVSEPSPLDQPLVARSSSATNPLISKGKTPPKSEMHRYL